MIHLPVIVDFEFKAFFKMFIYIIKQYIYTVNNKRRYNPWVC